MALPTGLAGSVAYGQETTVGTPVVVSRFLPMLGESLDGAPERIDTQSIFSGRTLQSSGQWQSGNINTTGTVQHEVYTKGLGLLFKNALGTVATVGSGPYTHTFTPGNLLGLGMTVQVGVPGVTGTVATKTMAGGKVAKMSMKHAIGANSTLDVDLVGMDISYDTALAAVTYPSGAGTPYVSKNITVTIAGTAVCTRSVTIDITNPFAERRCLGSTGQLEPLQNAYREITGAMELEFTDLSQYNRVAAATEAAVVITCTAGASSLTTTMNCRFDGGAPMVSGTDIVAQPLTFKAIATGADSTAFTMVMVNTDPTPT